MLLLENIDDKGSVDNTPPSVQNRHTSDLPVGITQHTAQNIYHTYNVIHTYYIRSYIHSVHCPYLRRTRPSTRWHCTCLATLPRIRSWGSNLRTSAPSSSKYKVSKFHCYHNICCPNLGNSGPRGMARSSRSSAMFVAACKACR